MAANPGPRRVLILGATSAIAAEVARLCARSGDDIYLIGRSSGKLADLVAELGARVRGYAIADLDELNKNTGRVDDAVECLGGLDVALIAHGLLGDQQRSESELDHALEILQTNFTSAVSLLIPLANYFERQGRGHLGVITSVAGERGRPRNYTYGAAKGGLTHYLEGVRSRLYRAGVQVHNLKLGPVDTPMTVAHDKHALFGRKDRVARGIFRELQRCRHVAYLPRVWGWIMAAVRVLPEPLFQRFDFLAGR